MLIAIKKIAPALAAGNSIVLKPSELAPVSVLELAKLCSESGLPDGVLNVVTGLGPSAGQALCSHPYIKKVDLTGGTSTGRLGEYYSFSIPHPTPRTHPPTHYAIS